MRSVAVRSPWPNRSPCFAVDYLPASTPVDFRWAPLPSSTLHFLRSNTQCAGTRTPPPIAHEMLTANPR